MLTTSMISRNLRRPWKWTFAALLVSAFVIAGCSSQANTKGDVYPRLYQTATETAQGNAAASMSDASPEKRALQSKFANFRGLFAEFKDADMRPRVESVYAEKLYFNDTLHTFNSREVMLQYMQDTADRVDFTNVDIKDIVQSGDDYYVRWAMDTGFTVFGKQIKTHSIGMTHIRFDESGLINFHQDFWDNTEVIGFLINRTKQRL